MASVSFDKQGRARLAFIHPDGTRPMVRLGRLTQRQADTVCGHVDAILTTGRYGTPLPAATAAWLGAIDDVLHDRLSAVGLVETRRRPTLAAFAREWADGRDDIKPFTRQSLGLSIRWLVEHFGPDRRMDDIGVDDARAFRDARAKYSRATVGRVVKHARQIYAAAIEAGITTVNPFVAVEAWACENPARKVFVERATIDAVLAAEHQPRYRRLIALARYGGLRVPSEIYGLDWSDFDWVGGTFRVRACKTRERRVPIFPELRQILEPDRQPAGPVVPGGDSAINWRQHLLRVIQRAGLEPWPKLFHNLRASRETELVRDFPLHVVCEWIGNSGVVAVRHYLTVQRSDIDRAVGGTEVAHRGTPAGYLDGVAAFGAAKNAPESARHAKSGALMVPSAGAEPGAESSENQGEAGAGGTEVSWWEQQTRRAA